ncbi:MAG: hypothetical protein ACLSUW_01565 [Akkermansia sp.]
MVTWDDLPDGAAAHFAQVIRAVRKASPSTIIEVLASDLNEKPSLHPDADGGPSAYFRTQSGDGGTPHAHCPLPRPYRRSLRVLRMALECVDGKVSTKSGIMLGLETEEELFRSMDDLLEHGVTVLTLGQYLRPSRNHLPVVKYVHPDDFARYEKLRAPKASGTWRPVRLSAVPTTPPISSRRRTSWKPSTKI